ncbi:MAG: class I SAM-dependent methyltransferase, partial [Acidimicrobiia bacterium]
MQPESSDDQGADPRRAEPKRVGVGAEAYDDQWARRAAAGESVHGEADLIERLLRGVDHVPRVLDAGCGTGRVAIRLAERGVDACGVDVDDALLERARTKAPTIPWHRGDLATLRADEVPGPFDAIVLAGNVMIFVAPGTEGAVLHNLASRLAPGGLLVAGF